MFILSERKLKLYEEGGWEGNVCQYGDWIYLFLVVFKDLCFSDSPGGHSLSLLCMCTAQRKRYWATSQTNGWWYINAFYLTPQYFESNRVFSFSKSLNWNPFANLSNRFLVSELWPNWPEHIKMFSRKYCLNNFFASRKKLSGAPVTTM